MYYFSLKWKLLKEFCYSALYGSSQSRINCDEMFYHPNKLNNRQWNGWVDFNHSILIYKQILNILCKFISYLGRNHDIVQCVDASSLIEPPLLSLQPSFLVLLNQGSWFSEIYWFVSYKVKQANHKCLCSNWGSFWWRMCTILLPSTKLGYFVAGIKCYHIVAC